MICKQIKILNFKKYKIKYNLIKIKYNKEFNYINKHKTVYKQMIWLKLLKIIMN